MNEPEALSESRVRRGLRLNMAAGALCICWMSMTISLPLTMFLEFLGASGAWMGFSVSVQQLAIGIQIPAALWAEKLSRRKSFWALAALPHRLVWLVPPLVLLLPGMPLERVITITIVTVAVSSILAHASVPSWYSWMADLVPTRYSGHFWGLRQTVTTAAFVIGMAFSGLILHRMPGLDGFKLLFIVGALLGAAGIIVHLGVPEPTPHRNNVRRNLSERLRSPWREPDFLWITVAMSVWVFSASLHASFVPVYLKQEFNIEYRHLVLLPIAGALSAICAGIPIGKGIDRLGARGLGVLLMAISPGIGFFWFLLRPGEVNLGLITLPSPVALLLIYHILAGGLYAGIGLCQIHLVNTITGRDGRTLAMAMHWTSIGAIGALGPFCGGAFMDFWNARQWTTTTFWGGNFSFFQVLILAHIGLAWLVAIPLLRRVRIKTGEMSARMILAAIRTGNPFRPLFPPSAGYQNTLVRNHNKNKKDLSDESCKTSCGN